MLAGEHQSVNAGTAIATLRCWKPRFWSLEDFSAGVSTAVWPGRLQCLESGALADLLPDGWQLWVDGGHNPSAGDALARAISAWPASIVVLVCAMQENKDVSGFLTPLSEVADRLIALDLPGDTPGHSPRTLTERRQTGWPSPTNRKRASRT